MTTAPFQTKILKVGNSCNSRCFFCFEKGKEYPTDIDALKREIEEARKECVQLTLTGQEPSIVPGITDLLAHAKSLDFRVIQMVTNGRLFAYAKFAEEAVFAGLNEVMVPFHARDAALHDRIAGVEGAHAQAARGVRNLLALSEKMFPYNQVSVTAGVVVAEENARDLTALVRWVSQMGVTQIHFIKLRDYPGKKEQDMRNILMPMLHGLDEALSRRMQIFTVGFSTRELGPYASLRYEAFVEKFPVLTAPGAAV